MVLAAGLGTRLKPITDARPKPLIEVGGQTMLDRMLDALAAAGVDRIVVNVHHLANMVVDHLATRASPTVTISHETRLLETGGGISKALPDLGDAPFFVANSDVVVLSGVRSPFDRLAAAWRADSMDALLLMQRSARAFGYTGRGDFFMSSSGALRRRREHEIAPYIFAGIQLLHPRLFDACPTAPFSINLLYDRALQRDRLFGVVHDGAWLHVGTPQALSDADAYLRRIT